MGGCHQGVTAIDEVRRVNCQTVTMQKFISMKTKLGGPGKNSSAEVEVHGKGQDLRCAGSDDEAQQEYAPLQLRVLDND